MRRAWILAEKVLVNLRYPLLRAHVPVPSYIHAWILAHPRLGNALYNLVRPAALCSTCLGSSALCLCLWREKALCCPSGFHSSLTL